MFGTVFLGELQVSGVDIWGKCPNTLKFYTVVVPLRVLRVDVVLVVF